MGEGGKENKKRDGKPLGLTLKGEAMTIKSRPKKGRSQRWDGKVESGGGDIRLYRRRSVKGRKKNFALRTRRGGSQKDYWGKLWHQHWKWGRKGGGKRKLAPKHSACCGGGAKTENPQGIKGSKREKTLFERYGKFRGKKGGGSGVPLGWTVAVGRTTERDLYFAHSKWPIHSTFVGVPVRIWVLSAQYVCDFAPPPLPLLRVPNFAELKSFAL